MGSFFDEAGWSSFWTMQLISTPPDKIRKLLEAHGADGPKIHPDDKNQKIETAADNSSSRGFASLLVRPCIAFHEVLPVVWNQNRDTIANVSVCVGMVNTRN